MFIFLGSQTANVYFTVVFPHSQTVQVYSVVQFSILEKLSNRDQVSRKLEKSASCSYFETELV